MTIDHEPMHHEKTYETTEMITEELRKYLLSCIAQFINMIRSRYGLEMGVEPSSFQTYFSEESLSKYDDQFRDENERKEWNERWDQFMEKSQ